MNIQNDISKGHDMFQNDISKKPNEIIGLFQGSVKKSLFGSIKKLEKIISATYMIIDIMDTQLPITTTLRTQPLELLSRAYTTLTKNSEIGRDNLVAILAEMNHFTALIRIGLAGHHISPMNATILITELDKVTQVLHSETQDIIENDKKFTISPPDIDQPIIPNTFLEDTVFADILNRSTSKRHQKDIKTTLLNQNDIQKDIKDIKTTFQKDTNIQNDISNKVDRKTKILDVVKSREISTIHDIKKMLPDIGEKTMQREINTLVEMGMMKREGNKRWTTYRAL